MKLTVANCVREISDSFFDYQTNKIAIIRNTKVVYFLRIFQLIILAYVIGYTLWYKRGYQDSYALSSSVIVKVKGIGLSNRSHVHRKVWDIADTVVPPQEKNALFITTNVIETSNQTQGLCAEHPSVKNATCKVDQDCERNKILFLGSGVMTGKCVQGIKGFKTCEIQAWCPVEDDSDGIWNKPLLKEVPNFTVLIKNNIIFDEINIQRSNLFAFFDGQIPNPCMYDVNDQFLKYCPIFKVSTLLGSINETDLNELLTYGGIVRVIVTWNCDLDFSVEKCRPEYSFERLFTKFGKFSKGWNFRYASYYEREDKEYRVLFKVFGIRILIEVRGKAQKLSLFTLSMNIGSGISLLTIATIVCDFIMTCCLPKRDSYCEIINDVHNIHNKKNRSKAVLTDNLMMEEKI